MVLAFGRQAHEQAVERLREVAIPSPRERMSAYPHELSGGMRQRVVIAAALIMQPSIIIADEPTTALDVTIQAEIMSLLTDLCTRRKMALILITHDLSLVAQTTDNIMVMYSGLVIEHGATAEVISSPRHPYTRGLLLSLSERGGRRAFLSNSGRYAAAQRHSCGLRFSPALRICGRALPARDSALALLRQRTAGGLSSSGTARTEALWRLATRRKTATPLCCQCRAWSSIFAAAGSFLAATRQLRAVNGVDMSLSLGEVFLCGGRIGLRQVHLGGGWWRG